MQSNFKNLPLVLAIIDGFGCGKPNEHNAIYLANPPYINRLLNNYGYSLLEASGKHVGLPDGQMGNSEVGHMTIGSGRVLSQDLVRINQAIETNEIIDNKELKKFIKEIQLKRNNTCHVMGMLSDGGVHSHENHIAKFIEILLESEINVKCHFFLDGRDTSPFSGIHSVEKIIDSFKDNKNFSIATITGRYYAMDRDNRWNRVEIAYDAIFNAKGNVTNDFIKSISTEYNEKKISDEFIEPIINSKYHGFEKHDSVISLNWRSDRMKQIINAIGNPQFKNFNREKFCTNILTITEYSKEINQFTNTIFPKQSNNNTLGEVIAKNNLKQLRIAETEKYAHVTFFFDGGMEKSIENCKQILVASPSVATYDLAPAMSAYEVTDKLIAELDRHDVFILNFANLDMVGHTGSMKATIEATNVIDECIQKLNKEIMKRNGVLIMTADHGNADEMYDINKNEPKTAHTLNPVPFSIISNNRIYRLKKHGALTDIAPTILHLIGIPQPEEMTGESLVIPNESDIPLPFPTDISCSNNIILTQRAN